MTSPFPSCSLQALSDPRLLALRAASLGHALDSDVTVEPPPDEARHGLGGCLRLTAGSIRDAQVGP